MVEIKFCHCKCFNHMINIPLTSCLFLLTPALFFLIFPALPWMSPALSPTSVLRSPMSLVLPKCKSIDFNWVLIRDIGIIVMNLIFFFYFELDISTCFGLRNSNQNYIENFYLLKIHLNLFEIPNQVLKFKNLIYI